jgi:DNA polymerase-3 subunit gamma/tau
MQDPESLAELKGLAQQYFHHPTVIRFKSLSAGEGGDAPPNLLEKKSLEETGRNRQLMEKAMKHPLIGAALEVFGGEIGKVEEIDNKH